MNFSNNVNSAIISGTLGIQRASAGITEHTSNLASLSLRSNDPADPQQTLVNAATNQLSVLRQSLPQNESNITSDLVGLSIHSTNANASAKVVGVAGDTIGTILDILA